VPIILFALLFFVLLAVGGVVLLSLALRYRAGTARRQGRRWIANLNFWMTSLSTVFFLSFTFLISFWLGTAFRFALIGMCFGAILGLLGLALTRWESQPEGLFYTPSRWLALLVTLAIAARFVYGWWHATHSGSSAPGEQHWLMTASGTELPGGGRRVNSLLPRLLHWSAPANHALRATAHQLKRITDLALLAPISSRLSFVCVAVSETLKQLPYEQQGLSAPVWRRTQRAGDVAGVAYAAASRANRS
jgi:hypothetical protein